MTETEIAITSDSPSPYLHWMLREIHAQPAALVSTRERYVEHGRFREPDCAPALAWLRAAHAKIVIAASGSSRHAGLIAELMIEDLSGAVVDVEYASEFPYRAERSWPAAAVMVLSQSGETADTLAALRKAKGHGLGTLAVTNVEHSTMAREASVSFPTLAGSERAIPATKSFTTQLLNVYLLALLSAKTRGTLQPKEIEARLAELASLPEQIEAQLPRWEAEMRAIAEKLLGAKSFLFLGRGLNYPIAREGALKLKESAYLHAEGYPAGELKHGPNALVAEGTPLVMLATVDPATPESVERYEKVVQLMRDMRAQGASILALANRGDRTVASLATHTVEVEAMREELLALCAVIPLQLFAYWTAVHLGIDVDHPRNLTKAVLAE